MSKKFFFGQYLIWVILLLGQLHGFRSCIEKERKALLELKSYFIPMSEEENIDYVLSSWSNDTKSDCCGWEGVKCSRTSGRVTDIAIIELSFKENSLLNLSLLHPFEELRSLNLSIEFDKSGISGFFDDNEGYKSLTKLKKLEILDLSYNNFSNNIFPFLNVVTSLKSLSLRYNKIEGSIPAKTLKDLINLELLDLSENMLNSSMPDFTHLRKLKYLDLSRNDFSSSMELQGYKSFRRLKNLENLDLSYNGFSGSIFTFLDAATSLKSLSLRNNHMESSIPAKALKNLINLELLDLSINMFHDSMPDFTNLRKLKSLDLSYTNFSSSMELKALTNLEVLNIRGSELSGSTSDLKDLLNLELINLEGNRFNGSMSEFCKMKNLQELNLNGNYFVGQLPLCLDGLKGLRVLELSVNQFSGDLPSCFNSLESLEYLSLLDNNFTGLMSVNPLTNLTKLKVFKLSSTSEIARVEVKSTLKPKFQLSVLVLRSCGLETIPSFLIYQKRLRLVDLSNNKLSKHIPTWFLANNPELEALKLQNNLFTILKMPPIVHHNLLLLDISANDIGGLFPDNIGRAFPNMLLMNISDNVFQGSFSLSGMEEIKAMDLSYNNFSGKLPKSFLKDCLSIEYLKLSHNKFEGNFLPRGINITSLQVLRINNNFFKGNIGVGLISSTGLSVLDMSNNCLTGGIPSWISNMRLSYLDLSGNQLSGVLPSHVSNSHGDLTAKVFLHNNKFFGPIPDTLLVNVGLLDLRNNKFSGIIPHFVNTESINILLLKGNNLTGHIPRKICDLSKIRILDLSDNKFNGFIPSCLYNLSFGNREEEMINNYNGSSGSFGFNFEFYRSTTVAEEMEINYDYFHEIEIKFATKKRYESYIGGSEFSLGILGYMYGMDLSNNDLSGIIPVELGDLFKLRALNLSHNLLSSSIPSSFSNLKDIESLDLSYNMLHGSIPHQLTGLNSLAVFDVSNNNLSGIIPQGRHFDTFNENSYLGNPFLCGLPTNKSCEAKHNSEEAANGEEEEGDEAYVDMLVFYYTAASTYVTLLIGIFVLMCIDCPWRRAWFGIIDALIGLLKGMLF